jgi:hypothetical protein
VLKHDTELKIAQELQLNFRHRFQICTNKNSENCQENILQVFTAAKLIPVMHILHKKVNKNFVLVHATKVYWESRGIAPFINNLGTSWRCVRDSSVGIATRYGLDGPGIESRWRRDFPQPSRPAVGPTQPPVQWVSGPLPGGKAAGAWG